MEPCTVGVIESPKTSRGEGETFFAVSELGQALSLVASATRKMMLCHSASRVIVKD